MASSNPRGETSRPAALTFWLIPALAVAVAAVPRLVALAGSDFPLNDGGLFVVMVRDIIADGFRLPTATSYNGAGIPFAYPPLALYLVALLVKATGVGILELLRWLPLLANLGTIVAFSVLARAVAPGRWSCAAAALLFPTLPFSIEWLLTGAGLTRSFGMLFLTLATLAAHRYLTTRRPVLLLPTILLASGAVLSHPESAASVAVTYALFWAILGRDRSGIEAGVAVAAAVAAATAPWWFTVIARHGAGPLVAAGETSEWSWARLLALPAFAISGETIFTPIAALALVGLVFDLTRRRLLVPCWLVASYLLPKVGNRAVILPLAVLAGEAIGEIIVPALRRARSDAATRALVSDPGDPAGTVALRRSGFPDLAPVLLLVFLVCYGTLSNAFRLAPSEQPIPALTEDERAAMAWVSAHTPPASRFVVVTSSSSWAEDPTSEWFPALAGRVSVATPQGREWLPPPGYQNAYRAYDALKSCAFGGVEGLERWGHEHGIVWTHVFVSKAIQGEYVPRPLVASLAGSPGYALVYDGPGAFVFSRRVVPSHK